MLILTHFSNTGVRVYHSDDLVAYEKGINPFAETIHSLTSKKTDFKNYYIDIIVKWVSKQANTIKVKLEDSFGNYRNLVMPVITEKKDFIFTIKDREKFDFFGISNNQNSIFQNEIKLGYHFPNHEIQKGYYHSKQFTPELISDHLSKTRQLELNLNGLSCSNNFQNQHS